jgi:hypothetical protein
MPDAEGAVRTFATLTGSLGGTGTVYQAGTCALSLVTPEQEDGGRDTASTPRGPVRLRWGLRPTCPGFGGAGPAALKRGPHPALGAGRWGLKPSSPARDNTVAGHGVAIGGSPQYRLRGGRREACSGNMS